MSSNGHIPEEWSAVERQKHASRGLRGGLSTSLEDSTTARMQDEDLNVLKFHGIYQQYDRDARAAGRQSKSQRVYSFMVRMRLPGGQLTAAQWLRLDALAQVYGGGSLRLTTRQSIQFHGVIKGELRALLKGMDNALMSTVAACGDIARNVMCCPSQVRDPLREACRRTTADVAAALAPKTRAWHEIWIDGERATDEQLGRATEVEDEPLYGRTYLPRKFKVGIAPEDDNCIDVYTQDCGLIGVRGEDGELEGFQLLVGGGLGMTHRKSDTFARLGSAAGFIEPDQAVDAVRHVVEIFRDHGNRADRRHARLKYLIEDRGLDWFREAFHERASFTLQPPRDLPAFGHDDHLGWTAQGDGRLTLGLFVENGRLGGSAGDGLLHAIRAIVQTHQPAVWLTGDQNILLADLDPAVRADVERLLGEHGIRGPVAVSTARRHAMACPALPTCGLALADAERALPGVIDALEPVLEELGLDREAIAVRMTGCPNGCARPYTADVALVGRGPGVYDVYVGGRLAGDRLVDLLAEKVEQEDVVDVLRPLLTAWRRERVNGEGLGDFWQRRHGRPVPRQTLGGEKLVVLPAGIDVPQVEHRSSRVSST